MQGYVARKGDRYYAVIYEGTDPITGRERRRWLPAGTDRNDAERLAADLAQRGYAAGVPMGGELPRQEGAEGGIRLLTKGMAAEFGPHGIQANAIGPGYMLTEMNAALTRQMKMLLARKERELQIALETERERNAVTRRVQEVARPAGNSCELAPECVRWFDDVLRSARPD